LTLSHLLLRVARSRLLKPSRVRRPPLASHFSELFMYACCKARHGFYTIKYIDVSYTFLNALLWILFLSQASLLVLSSACMHQHCSYRCRLEFGNCVSYTFSLWSSGQIFEQQKFLCGNLCIKVMLRTHVNAVVSRLQLPILMPWGLEALTRPPSRLSRFIGHYQQTIAVHIGR
jgi:hypothetical protein